VYFLYQHFVNYRKCRTAFRLCNSMISNLTREKWQSSWMKTPHDRATFDIIPTAGHSIHYLRDRCSSISITRLLLDKSELRSQKKRLFFNLSLACDCGWASMTLPISSWDAGLFENSIPYYLKMSGIFPYNRSKKKEIAIL
jgi:hypothetical protein